MTFTLNDTALQQIDDLLVKALENGLDAAVPVLKEVIHVDTGRMRESSRSLGAVVRGDGIIQGDLKVGGTEQEGIYREEGIVKLVDYAIFEELRHPQVSQNLPLIGRALIEGVNE